MKRLDQRLAHHKAMEVSCYHHYHRHRAWVRATQEPQRLQQPFPGQDCTGSALADPEGAWEPDGSGGGGSWSKCLLLVVGQGGAATSLLGSRPQSGA